MKYFTLALLGICTLQAAERSEHDILRVNLQNAKRYNVTYKELNDEECTTITLTKRGFSERITYKSRLEGERLTNAIEDFDRSIKTQVEKLNEGNSFNLLAKKDQFKTQCCVLLLCLGVPPLLDVAYQLISSAL